VHNLKHGVSQYNKESELINFSNEGNVIECWLRSLWSSTNVGI